MMISICIINELVHWAHMNIHMCTHTCRARQALPATAFQLDKVGDGVWPAVEH